MRREDETPLSVDVVLAEAASIASAQRFVAEIDAPLLSEGDAVHAEISRLRSGGAGWRLISKRVDAEGRHLTRARHAAERAGTLNDADVLPLVSNECCYAAFRLSLPWRSDDPGDADERTCGQYLSWTDYLRDIAASIVESRGILNAEPAPLLTEGPE